MVGASKLHSFTDDWKVVALCLCVLLLCVPLGAQSDAGSAAIYGVVVDQQGLRIPNVTVTLTNTETGYTRTLKSDDRGTFLAQVMPLGSYALVTTAEGFESAKRDKLHLTVGNTEVLEIALELAGVSGDVAVNASQVSLDTQGSGAGSTILERAVRELPLRGRNFTEFVQLGPAILQEGDRLGLVISGQRSISSNVSLDGADFNDPVQGNQRGGSESVFYFPQSAVREFQVVRSGAGAEVGRTNAGFVNVVTKSGSNEWHGELLYMNRNQQLTSPDAFGRSLDNKQNQFGGSLGGRMKKDRAFVFLAVEQNLLRVPVFVKFDNQAPGVTVPANLQALQGAIYGTNDPIAGFGRTDFILNSHNTLNLEYTRTTLSGQNFNFASPLSSDAPSVNYTRESSSHTAKGSLVTVLSANTVNELRGQDAIDDGSEIPNLSAPLITITGFGRLGGDANRPRQSNSRRYQGTDNLNLKAGPHHLRLGADFNYTFVEMSREENLQGRYDFKSLSDYLAGKVNRYRQTVAMLPSAAEMSGVQRELAAYVQDQINLRRDLTLTAGIRWEGLWNPQPPNPNPGIPVTGYIPKDLRQWQPRLALAWDVGGRGSTVIRLSSGIFDARTPASVLARTFSDNGINTVAVDSKFDPAVLKLLTFPNSLTSIPAGIVVPAPRVFGFDRTFRNPRSLQAAATIEQQAGRDLVISAGYLRSSTWNLQRRLDRNLFAPKIDATGMPIYPVTRPNPAIGQLSITESSAHSSYDALIITARKQAGAHLQFQANYTYSYNYDDESNERAFTRETALNVFDLNPDRAFSKQDVRHSFNINTLVSLPKGFSVGAVTLARTAFPYVAIIGFDTQNDANDLNDRAIINGRVVGRNSFRQPIFFDLDLRLTKAFNFGERHRLEFTADWFNATKESNLNFGADAESNYGTPDAPVNTAGQALFAPSTARYGGPRQIQLGVRYIF